MGVKYIFEVVLYFRYAILKFNSHPQLYANFEQLNI